MVFTKKRIRKGCRSKEIQSRKRRFPSPDAFHVAAVNIFQVNVLGVGSNISGDMDDRSRSKKYIG